MLLTIAKTGSATCRLSGRSAARFGEAQSVPPVIEGSKPQAVVTLTPGEYADEFQERLSRSGWPGHRVRGMECASAELAHRTGQAPPPRLTVNVARVRDGLGSPESPGYASARCFLAHRMLHIRGSCRGGRRLSRRAQGVSLRRE